MLKDYLAESGIPFENVFVDQDEVARTEMTQDSGGFLGVPFTVITKDDGAKETVLGFDKKKIDEVLDLA